MKVGINTLLFYFIDVLTDCEGNRDYVNFNSLSTSIFGVTNEANQQTPLEIFSGSGQTSPFELENEYLVMIFDLGSLGTKELISMSFIGENIDSIIVKATSDETGEESEEFVSIFKLFIW